MSKTFKTYESLEYHDSLFNVLFLVMLAAIASIVAAVVLWQLNFFDAQYSWIVGILLALNPVIVLFAIAGEAEFKTAYYKTAKDLINGVIDQRKILQSFARQYNIKNWRRKIENIKVDGRWNFHANTEYMEYLANNRNLLINKLHEEYVSEISELDKKNLLMRKDLKNAELELEKARTKEKKIGELINKAKTPGEIYEQRREFEKAVSESTNCEKIKNNLEQNVEDGMISKAELQERYSLTRDRIMKIYYMRYAKYTEKTIKKINKINGLRYVISDMPDVEKG